MLGHFGDLHQATIGGEPAEHEPRRGQPLAVVVVELEAVAVALEDDRLAVGRGGRTRPARRYRPGDPAAPPRRRSRGPASRSTRFAPVARGTTRHDVATRSR